jgi:FkbM family methyltransferase
MKRPLPFVLAATDHGPMIVSRLDFAQASSGEIYGVGAQLLSSGAYDPAELMMGIEILGERREVYGDGVVAIDCGANVGVHAVTWGVEMNGWGELIAFEAQERLFYALAGNLALNNVFNARAVWAAVGDKSGQMQIPRPNYLTSGSLGSLELRYGPQTEFIGQAISYEPEDLESVMVVKIDDLGLPRVDLLKIDVEGMEVDVITGAANTIERCRPVMMIEYIKTGAENISHLLSSFGYDFEIHGLNMIARPR